MARTVFEKVISGEFEGSFVYRDDLCVGFMDLHPQAEGHVLIVPREPIDRITALPPDIASHLFRVAQKVLAAMEKSEIRLEGANLLISDGDVAGQEVPHVHLHIVPRYAGDGLKLSFGQPFQRAKREDLDRVADLISKNL